MSRGLTRLLGLFASALMLALAPIPALAQVSGSASAAAAPDAADDKEARDLFQIGKDAFDEGRFERALKYFQDAYNLSHRAALLSNIGTAFDRLRRDQEAVDTYRKYLEQVPQAPNRRLIEERIRIIESALARSRPAPPATVPLTVPSETALQPTAAEPTASMKPASEAKPSTAREPIAPTPEQTARAAEPFSAQSDPRHPSDVGTSPVTSRWWFWTGIGAVAIAAVVVVVAVSAGGGSSDPQRPTLLDPQTRVREL